MKKLNEKMETVKELKEILKGTKKDNNGYRLLIRVERVAKSGMSRCLSIYAQKGDYTRNITYLVSEILEETYTKDGFMRVSGCGMDMAFNTCYELNATVKFLENYKGKKKTNYDYLVSTCYDIL